MVVIQVNFCLGSKRWSKEFDLDEGSSVHHLKGRMLGPKGGQEDVNMFELRRDRKRVPDYKLMWEDCAVDFKFLGADRGMRRASKDAADAEAAKTLGMRVREPNLESVLALQTDLMEGFGTAAFQSRLDALEEKHKGNERLFHAERQKLFLSVQKLVLPKWGFAGTAKGVFEMMTTLSQAHFNADYRFQKNGWLLNKLLRLGPVGPEPPGAPQAPQQPPGKQEALAEMTEVMRVLESRDFRRACRALDPMKSASTEDEVRAAFGLLVPLAHMEMLERRGKEASETNIKEKWTRWAAFGETDAEIVSCRKKLEELVMAGRAFQFHVSSKSPREAEATKGLLCAGSWSPQGKACTYYSTQLGKGVVFAFTGEAWGAGRGRLLENKTIVLDAPENMAGFRGELKGDAIVWQAGEPMHRHVETSATVSWGPGANAGERSVKVPPGGRLVHVLEQLRLMDMWKDRELRLARVEDPEVALDEQVIVTPLINKFCVCGYRELGLEPLPWAWVAAWHRRVVEGDNQQI